MYDEQHIEERIDHLETLLGDFIVNTSIAIKSVSRDVSRLSNEMRDFKDETKQERKKMNKQWGDLANKMGTIVEDIIAPSIRPVVKKYFGCEIFDFMINRKVKNKTLQLHGEFDVIAVSENYVFLVETKSSPNVEKLEAFIENIKKFKELFSEYNKKRIIPFFASLRFEENLVNKATTKGIYCLAYREWDYMDLLNYNEIIKK